MVKKNNDKVKYKECIENDVTLLYFTYELNKKPNNCFHDLIFDENELKEKINNLILYKNGKSNRN